MYLLKSCYPKYLKVREGEALSKATQWSFCAAQACCDAVSLGTISYKAQVELGKVVVACHGSAIDRSRGGYRNMIISIFLHTSPQSTVAASHCSAAFEERRTFARSTMDT